MSFGQGGPYGPPPQDPFGSRDPQGQTPDWAALADASAQRARRRRWMLIGGGALATAAVAAIVATAVVTMNGDGGGGDRASDKNSSDLPAPPGPATDSADPGPSFSDAVPLPPPNPKDFISTEDKDTAPLSADTLFPGSKLTMGDRVYAKGPTNRTTNCAGATQGALGSILAANTCDQVIRATYTRDGTAVTVGVAVFSTETQALKAKKEASGGLASLSGSGVPTFCRGGTICRKTTNSVGRYVYFTVGGFTNGKDVVKGDQEVFDTGDDVAEFTFLQIRRRGEAQASAAATAPVED
ncbi:hypothetical protein [Streptomyces niveus]|uniref:Tat pathway signal sequence domain protein n=1 Tax=Streptomyces niveus TaxID=193462 RepID=A0ABZ2A6H4_STRNV|nr:hypothetical protein [Streptomyces niveus]WTA61210.1 hypothetical protein OG211_23420 [Streptomyces niveus]